MSKNRALVAFVKAAKRGAPNKGVSLSKASKLAKEIARTLFIFYCGDEHDPDINKDYVTEGAVLVDQKLSGVRGVLGPLVWAKESRESSSEQVGTSISLADYSIEFEVVQSAVQLWESLKIEPDGEAPTK